MACLVSTNINTRCYGAAILRNFGAEAKALVPILHRLMNDITECDDSRIRAAGVMGTIGPNARFAIPEIQRLLISDSHRLRAGAAIALGHFGNLAEGSLPALRSLLKDPDDGIRSIAQRAIVEIENGSGSTASEAKTKGNESQQGGGEERR
jgi:HEAT repeat protein